jgi:O-methyltransferase
VRHAAPAGPRPRRRARSPGPCAASRDPVPRDAVPDLPGGGPRPDGGDYFRYATLGLAVQRLADEGREGALAEVGVWRGETSALLHRLAPERRLYLFDTFEGFPERDLPAGVEDRRFRDTSAAAVRARVGPSENVVLRPGYVPDTLAGLEDERFALVLLDLDLFDPTVAGLEFLYPRIVPGGYLFVHDYNNPESDWACKRALDRFLEDKPELVVELGDVWGSAVVRRL